MIRVLIADDQELIRDSLSYILDTYSKIKIIGTVRNGIEAIDAAILLKPDIILMDVRMPVMDGIRAMETIREKDPSIKIIVLTTFDEDEYIFESIKQGAAGYLLKNCSTDELASAIEDVYSGKALLNPEITKKVFNLFSDMAKSVHTSINRDVLPKSITKNELKIIKLTGMGYSNKEINYELKMSEGTVRNYISSILQKLNLRDRTQIAIFAVQNGLTLIGE
ncbi:MAG: DNA-binding response regulator [Spirochaetaceae bacterium 4572_59]|nr:MAG: DNA-binding response regulator [Spirochaetaceae bacterium 4572_59]